MIEINCAAPDFTLLGSDNQEHKLSHYRGTKVILYFYPRDNTPVSYTHLDVYKRQLFNSLILSSLLGKKFALKIITRRIDIKGIINNNEMIIFFFIAPPITTVSLLLILSKYIFYS